MKTTTIAVLALLLSACVPLHPYPSDLDRPRTMPPVYGYALKLVGETPPLPEGLVLVAAGDENNLMVRFGNQTKATARINWARSTIVLPDNSVSAPVIDGQKLADRNQPAAPTIVPTGADATIGISAASLISWGDGRWDQAPMFHTVRWLKTYEDDRIAAYGGQPAMRLLLFIEHPDFPTGEVTIPLRVASIERLRCEFLVSTPLCSKGYGSVYPTRTPTPVERAESPVKPAPREPQRPAPSEDHQND